MFNTLMRAGWLGDLTNWLVEQIKAVWTAFMQFMGDLFFEWLSHTLEMATFVFALIPAPEFLNGSNLQTLFGQGGPTIGWLIATFQIDKCMGVIAGACVFYIVRRFVTLGIW
ncbi:hypothetical protein GGR77_000138 [Xanthomonas translucens]